MPVLRYISILTLNLLIILESTSLSVAALASEDIAVNSLDALSLPIETIDQEIASAKMESISKEIKPELKLDIQSLLEANQAYREKNGDIIQEINNTVENNTSTTDILSSLGMDTVFGDFLISSDTQLLD